MHIQPYHHMPSAIVCGRARTIRPVVAAFGKQAGTATHRDVVLLDFTQFAIKKKIEFSKVRPDVGSDGVRGVFATFPVAPGDTLISVPKTASLVVTAAERSPMPTKLPDDTWSRLPWYAQLAVKLCMQAAATSVSSMQEFIRALPQQPVDLPVLWGPGDIEALQYPYLSAKVMQEQQDWQGIYGTCAACLTSMGISQDMFTWALTCIRSRSFAGPHFKTPFKFKLALFAALQTFAVYQALIESRQGGGLWLAGVIEAAAILLPAAWAAADAKDAQTAVEYVVCPFIDFLNHSSESQAECQYDWLRDSYCVVSDRSYQAGQQVVINYGSQSNDQLLQVYGFVEPGNKYDRYVMSQLHQWLIEGPLGDIIGREWLQQQLSLQPNLAQAVLTSGRGFDQEVYACIERILQQQGATTAAQRGLTTLVDGILADACERELAACGSTLEEDRQMLADLNAAVDWALNPPPPLPEVIELLDVDSGLTGACSDGGSEHSEGVLAGTSPAAQSGFEGGERQAVSMMAAEQPSSAQHQEHQHAPVFESMPMPVAMEPDEVERLLQSFPRQRVILQFRIEKKSLLSRSAAQLRRSFA